jgi:hypothetical protein
MSKGGDYENDLRSAFTSFINDGGTDKYEAAEIYLIPYVRNGVTFNELFSTATSINRQGITIDDAVKNIMNKLNSPVLQKGGKRRTSRKRPKKRSTRRRRRSRR